MTMFNRVREPELMDDPSISEESHIEALDDLANVNKFSRIARRMWRPIHDLYQAGGGKPLRVLDLATGSGDTPIALRHIAKKKEANIEFNGCDLSERCVQHASRRAEAQEADVSFFQLDVVTGEMPEDYDVIMCVQFMHHLDPPQIIAVLRKMQQSAKQLVLVNDLTRSYVALGMVWLGTRILSNSAVVHFDGPASIRAAFTVTEWREIAEQADLSDYQIRTCFPVHMMLSCRRSATDLTTVGENGRV